MKVVEAPAARLTDETLVEKATPDAPPFGAMPTDQTTGAPVVFRIRTVTARVEPDPEGTAPKLTLTGSSAALAPAADSRLSRPEPDRLTSVAGPSSVAFSRTPASAVLTTALRTAQAGQDGCCWRMTAAAPARCGVAIDVPWKNAKHGSPSQKLVGIDDRTFTPGAMTSGLTRRSTSVGPSLEKSAITSAS